MKRKNKNSKPNAFNLFREDLLEKKSYRFIGYHEVQQKWNELSENEKEEYKERAKKIKLELRLPASGKSLSNTTPQSEFKKRLKIERIKICEEDVKKAIENARNLGLLDDKVFYIVSTETFYEDPRDVFPCELAIAKFSLKRGIFDVFQIRINPGPLPLGTAFMAREKSKNKHRYPLPNENENEEFGERSYVLILEKIISFLHPLDEIPMFFAEGHPSNNFETLYNTKRTLQKIFIGGCEYQIARELQVYSISDLFYYLRDSLIKSSCNQELIKFSNATDAHDKFTKIGQMYLYGIDGCNYHHEEDCIEFCCLSKVRRFCYIIASFCCDKTKYEMIKGQHYPKNYDIKM